MTVYISKDKAERLKTMVYHKDIPEVSIEHMSLLRQNYIDLACTIIDLAPECRSKSLCLTYLEESLTRCIQALALTGTPDSIEE